MGFVYVSYSENPATTESIARQRENPEDPDIPDIPPVIDLPGTANAFINERFQATLSQSFSRNDLRLSGFLEKQVDFVTQDESIPPDDREQYGVTLDWAFSASDKTQLTTFGRWSNQQLTTDGARSDLYVIQLTATYALGRRTDLDVWVARTERIGEESDTEDYTEHQIGLQVNMTF